MKVKVEAVTAGKHDVECSQATAAAHATSIEIVRILQTSLAKSQVCKQHLHGQGQKAE